MEEKNIYEILKSMEIEYKVLEHEPISSVKEFLFTLEGQQVKNIVLKAKKTNNHYFVILHDEKSINLSDLAEKLGEKRLSFASSNVIEENLKCIAGAITAFGLMYDTNNIFKVIVDKAVDKTTTIGMHPFINTKTLNIKYSDFEKFLKKYNHDIEYIDL
ncbi:YbaK/EbsC family protein [Oceanivirga miroungae]|uniref:Prolyl-tRNA editing protein ProX n=1 Tax=Oceanivirga miroungae TaxID=1130046 RepID=A0A6I8MEH5_9FUSO|nr:YbaK/EbsC family protein [Oceanivirga miroungae]VWL85899.1 Prolyl-tRNA editing protein ProX [Oceanivirga miroungae]